MSERNIVGIVDAGGRGATLARMYELSPHVDGVVVIPGNDMIQAMAQKPTSVFTDIDIKDAHAICDKFQELGVNLVDVAQEDAVASGVSDTLRASGIPTIGPSKAAGEIEWSKATARKFGTLAGIIQPEYAIFERQEAALKYIDTREAEGFAIKADGLASGKAVIIAQTHQEAREAITAIQKRYPQAAQKFLIEQLVGEEEFSTFFASDGLHVKIIGHAQDHKREGNFDTGENTGGMGCSSPPKLMTRNVEILLEREIQKMMVVLNNKDRPYEGIGYYGGMLDHVQRIVNNIEWNARWGDPEVQVVAPGITSDMYELAMAIVNKNLDKYKLTTDSLPRVVVAGASRGYPRNYDSVKGKQIFGLDEVMEMDGIELYGAGVKVVDGKHFASGGRLFDIVCKGVDIVVAREKAYGAMARVFVEGNNLHYRTDIGWRDVQRLREKGY